MVVVPSDGIAVVRLDECQGSTWKVCEMIGKVLSPDLMVVTKLYILEFIKLYICVIFFELIKYLIIKFKNY